MHAYTLHCKMFLLRSWKLYLGCNRSHQVYRRWRCEVKHTSRGAYSPTLPATISPCDSDNCVCATLVSWCSWSRRLLPSHVHDLDTSAPDAPRLGTGIAQPLERRTRDWKVAGSNPCRSGRGIFLFQCELSVLTLISVSVPPPCYRSST